MALPRGRPFEKKEVAVEWRLKFRNRRNDLGYQQRLIAYWREVMKGPAEAEMLEEMLEEMAENTRRIIKVAESECPMGFFKPSWEQAQVLNAWSPEFEPDIAPQGYRSVMNFGTNRGGKTTADVLDTLLWCVPNDPEWLIFEEFPDEEGKKHGKDRGNYRVLPRPDWELWRRTGKMYYPWLDAPPKGPCEIWHGIENDNAWHDKNGREYLKWIPKAALGKRSDGGTAIYKQERRIETRYGHAITGKTFNSDVQDWAGKAVWRINMDEGFDRRIFNEATLRIESGGYFHWAYTVAEARNIGERAKLAYECYQGKHNLVGQAKFFTGFRMDMIPEHIMPADKKADDLARLRKEGEIGRVRMGEIPFAVSSPVVFANFDRDRNILPLDGADVLLAIKGHLPERWKTEFSPEKAQEIATRFHRANIIRGMDEGLANPTACVWVAILRTGEYVAFRDWEQSGLSVGERCAQIIDRSGNERKCQNPNAEEDRRIYREQQTANGMKIRRTFADSKMFKRNPEHPQDDWTETYRRAGLSLERATNIGPASRCDQANDMLRGEPTRRHIMEPSKPGARAYVTRDCVKLIERLENYLWQQITQGANAGQFTDKPENKDDHELDAWTYAACSKLKWVDEAALLAQANSDRRVADPVTGYVRAA